MSEKLKHILVAAFLVVVVVLLNWSFNILYVFLEVPEREVASSLSHEREISEGFGKLYPSIQASQPQEEHSDSEQDLTSDVISRKELEKGRLSRDGKYDLYGQHSGTGSNKTDHSFRIMQELLDFVFIELEEIQFNLAISLF